MDGRSPPNLSACTDALARQGLAKREVARLRRALEAALERSEARGYAGPYPCVLLEARVVEVTRDGRTLTMAVVLAIHLHGDGRRELLGADVGPSDDRAYWLGFLRRLAAPDAGEVPLVANAPNWPLAAAFAAG
jgi:transposase-like protein